MTQPADHLPLARDAESLAPFYRDVRQASLHLTATLETEDHVVQTMPDVSPTKWHLAHTTWFFERFVLTPHLHGYTSFHPRYDYLFNSYYYTVGQMHLRPQRGLLTRPTVAEIRRYRQHVDEHVSRLIGTRGDDPELAALITLGLHHEQQHQELILTDIKHVLGSNPLRPALREPDGGPIGGPSPGAAPARFVEGPHGISSIGHAGAGFCFDNETPRHEVLVRPHALGARPVSNADYFEFIQDDGYRRSELWLSDGWSTVTGEGWERPLYWDEDLATQYTLHGPFPLVPDAPVCHVSFYEADAYARWAGARLPTEAELELAANTREIQGNFVESGRLHPAAATRTDSDGMAQIHGDVWEWTQSSYAPYPGFTPLAGSLGEYNGKFMCNQMVLRGGSCATPASHMRSTYRNFFYPQQRWQFSGIRLAQDLA